MRRVFGVRIYSHLHGEQVMANNLYKFPERPGAKATPEVASEPTPSQTRPAPGKLRKAISGLARALWMLLVLTWPVLRWVMALDVAYRGFLTVWHWDTPGSHAGFTFFLHFAALTAATFLVSSYKPKSVE